MLNLYFMKCRFFISDCHLTGFYGKKYVFYANVCKSDVYIFCTAADCLNHCVLLPFFVQKAMFCRLKDHVLYCKRASSAVRMIELWHENQWKTAGCCGNIACILAVLCRFVACFRLCIL